VVVIGTLVLRSAARGEDRTRADDYVVEAGDPGVEAVPSTVGG
jgi:hypothetical protein